MLRARAALVVSLFLLPVAVATHAGPNRAPFEASILARAYSGATIYDISSNDRDGDELTFTWNASLPCGSFKSPPDNFPATSHAAQWTWQTPTSCAARPTGGFVQVVVDDGHGHRARAYYLGPDDGTGPRSTPLADDEDPRDEPRPTVTGESLCDKNDADGSFAPSQGVWQDDEDFPDAAGKQLSRDAQFDRAVAELPMVKDRPTLLFGTRDERYVVPYNVTLAGSVVGDAKVRVQAFEFATSRLQTVYEYPPGASYLKLNIFGACAASSIGKELTLPAPRGLPDASPPFRFESAGEYRIIMELVDARGRVVPNTQVEVTGETVDVPETKVRLVGLTFGGQFRLPREGEGPYLVRVPPRNTQLAGNVERIADEMRRFMPDYYPIARGDLVVEEETRDLGLDLDEIARICQPIATSYGFPAAIGQSECIAQHVRSRIYGDEMRAAWASGARATVLVLTPDAWDQLQRSGASAGGEGIADKLAIVRETKGHWVVAHEIAHVTPWLFSAKGDCGRDFHLVDKTYANGFRIEVGGVEARVARDDITGMMDSFDEPEGLPVGTATVREPRVWIEQCTYWHLLRELQSKRDPPLQAVALQFLRLGGNETAEVLAGLTMDGEPDILPGASGSHALVFRDASGVELVRYGFSPSFENETGARRAYAFASMRVERPAAAARLDVDGPNRTLLSRELGSTRPTVAIDPITSFNATTLSLAYRATGTASSMTYSVYASADEGRTWRTIVASTNATSAWMDSGFFPGGTHLIRVVASDGLQSGEATLTHSVPVPIVAATPSSATSEGGGSPTPAASAALVLVAVLAVAVARRRL